MHNENYINIQGWMINKLNLTGNELVLYAIIYGFSQDGQSEFYGSIRYIMKFMGVSSDTAQSNLKKLINKKLIKRTKESHYQVYQKLVQGVPETGTVGVPETGTNKYNTNNKYNNNKGPVANAPLNNPLKEKEFNNFWNLYDKKTGLKKKVYAKWEKLSNKEKEAIIKYIPKYKQSQPNKQYRKNPETFLNNRGWEDELVGEIIINNNIRKL